MTRENQKERKRMKVYAVVMKCRDNFYPDYRVVDD